MGQSKSNLNMTVKNVNFVVDGYNFEMLCIEACIICIHTNIVTPSDHYKDGSTFSDML